MGNFASLKIAINFVDELVANLYLVVVARDGQRICRNCYFVDEFVDELIFLFKNSSKFRRRISCQSFVVAKIFPSRSKWQGGRIFSQRQQFWLIQGQNSVF